MGSGIAQKVWVQVNDEKPELYLLEPSTGKLNLGFLKTDLQAASLNAIRTVFADDGRTLLSIEEILGQTEAGKESSNPLLVQIAQGGIKKVDLKDGAAENVSASSKVERPLEKYAKCVYRVKKAGETTGSSVFITADGVFVAALHSFLFEGVIEIEDFTVAGYHVEHIVSFPNVDILVGRVRCKDVIWAYLPLEPSVYVGLRYSLVSYPVVVDNEAAQDDESWPTITQGCVSAIPSALQMLGDPEAFPNSSGGAACADGKLVGLHLACLTYEPIALSQESEEETQDSSYDAAWEGPAHEKIVATSKKAVGTSGTRSAKQEKPAPFSPDTLSAKMRRAEANATQKSTLCLLVPSSLLQLLLDKYGILQAPVVSNLQSAPSSHRSKRKKTAR